MLVYCLVAGLAIIALMFPPAYLLEHNLVAPWFFVLFTVLEVARETTELSYDSCTIR